jgi:hypothetical protein
VKLFSSRRRAAAIAAVVLLLLFLVRPGVSRLKARIVNSLSQAVARPSEVGSVHLRFLPRPGFDLENLVIYEDPAFGAEPMLRAPEVTAVVRLSSLLRGRLDISRLELTEPSLNLVRREDGRWNWEALLEHSARTPLAPTAKSKRESRPGFPYIEASSGRINFKTGAEKKPYALLDADFSLWQESENSWGVRLLAQPLRTDMNLSDTGRVRMNGVWQRAGSLRETPVQLSLSWEHAQLGQLSKLILGNDKGWRGDIQWKATLNGTPAAMQVATDLAIQNFHRYDISTSESLSLAAHCEARYGSTENMFREIFCNAPVGSGMVMLHGDASFPEVRRAALVLNVDNVPANALAQLFRRAKKDLPADLMAIGSVQGNFNWQKDGNRPNGTSLQGRGEIANFRLQSPGTSADLAVGTVPFALSSNGNSPRDSMYPPRNTQRSTPSPMLDAVRIEFGPFPVALGRPSQAQARGWIGPSGYEFAVRGEGELSHTLRIARLVGLPALDTNVQGAAQFDLQIAGSWTANAMENAAGFSSPKVTGLVQLRNVHSTLASDDRGIEISSAELKLLPEIVRVDKLIARAGNADWTGMLEMPRGCGTPGACLVHFNLSTEELNLSGLSDWLAPQIIARPWYQVLNSAQPGKPSFLNNLRASGKVSATRLQVHNLAAERASATLNVDHGKLKLSDLRAVVLGGKHLGDWQADLAAASPQFSGEGTLTGISLSQAADAMQDSWISGTASGNYQFKSSATGSAAFWQSVDASLRFDVRDGTLSRISLSSDAGPLQVSNWQGRARLRDGKIEIEKGSMVSPSGTYEISGTASFGQELDFKLIEASDLKTPHAGSMIYGITGTLAEPRVAAVPVAEAQAQLKP